MSRIGKAPITIPNGVQIEVKKGTVSVKGPKGHLSQVVHPDMQFEQEDGVLTVKRPSDTRQHRSLHGLTRALINNMVLGVSDGFTKILRRAIRAGALLEPLAGFHSQGDWQRRSFQQDQRGGWL